MRGEFVGVWSETLRKIWQPLIDEPLGENEEGVPEDIFCELYRDLAKALKKPMGDDAIVLLLEDGVTLREAFERSAQRADPKLEFELVDGAFRQSDATELTDAGERRTVVEAALTTLLGQPSASLMDAQLQELAQDPSMVEAASRRALERIINDQQKSHEAFENTKAEDLAGERTLVGFLESANETLEEFGGDELTNRYFKLLNDFIDKFSLRYDLRRPCTLCPTLPGIFASLVRDLREFTGTDPHLDILMKDFENAVRDLRYDCSDVRIKTCIQKHVNLLEALGWESASSTYPKALVNREDKRKAISTFMKHFDWPHGDMEAALRSLYGFTCDYPGIRHGGTPEHAKRPIDMRDMMAMSISFTGFMPYLCNGLDTDAIFGGGGARAGPIPSAVTVPALVRPVSKDNSARARLNGIWAGFFGYLRGWKK